MRIGLCGFTMAMEDYALHFPVVEVQNTFYEPPRNEVLQCPASFTPERENVERMRRSFERVKRPAARLLWEPRGGRWGAERAFA